MRIKISADLPPNLKYFDELPDSALVRQPIVEALFSCSNATIWRWSKKGIIPAPRKISPRVTVWNVGELRAAIKAYADEPQSKATVMKQS